MQPVRYPRILPFRHSVYSDWQWLLLGSIFSFLFASILLSGWPSGLIPNLSYPYTYGGDANFISWEIQRVIEGWVFDNSRSGYPFGSNFLDYPHSDNGNLLVLKGLGALTGSYYAALNLYLLLGFPLAFISSFLVFKAFSLRSIYAFSAALLFTFAHFHFWRLFGHVFYTWYFVVPLYFYYGWKIFLLEPSIWPLTLKKFLVLSFTLILLSSFGVYYAFFGTVTFMVCGFACAIKKRKFQGIILSLILSSMVALGVSLNTLPHLLYKHQNGPNSEVTLAHRPTETETFGLKITPLILPQANHRIKKFGHLINTYSRNFAVSEAVYSVSLGFFAALGFIILILTIFWGVLGRKIDIRLSLFSILLFSFLLIATTSSLSVLFALYISPAIRGWNRISIFISFISLAALFLLLQQNTKALHKNKKLIFYSIPLSILVLGLLDQTPTSYTFLTTAAKNEFIKDREFIKKIEAILPANSAIYQLPYMGFPEYGPYVNLPDYELVSGYLNSKTLRWSHAGMKGRIGDLFYRYLSKEPIDKQLEVIRRLGFAGIYIDRYGFADSGNEWIAKLNSRLGQPTLVREDRQVFFYRIEPVAQLKDNLSVNQIMEQAGYRVTDSGPSYPATLGEGIDFTRCGVPLFIKDIKGLSGAEPWGRWSDANLFPSVRLDFIKPLPNQFDLVLSTVSYGPNVDKNLKVIVGDETYYTTLHANLTESHLSINLKGRKIASIELVPPAPSSSKHDPRKLGIGLVHLKIIPQADRQRVS